MGSLTDIWNTRLISRVLSLYYVEDLSQGEIAQQLGLSAAKVNRLLRQARDQGMVEIHLKIPAQEVYELEREIEKLYGLQQAVVVPSFSQDEVGLLQRVGEAAAKVLLHSLRGNETICIGGGRALLELVRALRTVKRFRVKVVPAIGGVQGTHFSDVNYLAAELAQRLGGSAHQLHAPAFVESKTEKEALLSLRHVQESLDLARKAQLALVGIGSLIPETSSYFQFTSLPLEVVASIIHQENGCGEILAQMIDPSGRTLAPDYAERVIGLSLQELQAIPHVIGVASSLHKVPSILGALRGRYIHTLITDEFTAQEILRRTT